MGKKVFVSSTNHDLVPYRVVVESAINTLDMKPIMQEYFSPGEGGAVKLSLQYVRRADIFVGIIAHRYGYVPAGDEKSVTEQEYWHAVKHNIPRLMFLVDDEGEFEWNPEYIEGGEAEKKLNEFKTYLNKNEVRGLFTTPESLAAKLPAALIKANERVIRIQRFIIAAIVALIFVTAAIVTFIARPDIPVRLGILPVQPMDRGFNVLVVGIGVVEGDKLSKSPLADDITDIIVSNLSQYDWINDFRSYRDPRVGFILEGTEEEREVAAKNLAIQHNASIVIYGTVREEFETLEYAPTFYIAPSFARNQPEFIGSNALGEPVVFIKDFVEIPAPLNERITLLQNTITGLGRFYSNDNAGALEAFDSAIADSSSQGIEVLYIFAGNASTRAANDTTDRTEREAYLRQAIQYYSASLAGNEDYARGILGRGAGYFKLATFIHRLTPQTLDQDLLNSLDEPCYDNSQNTVTDFTMIVYLAETCIETAGASTDWIATSDIDVKYRLTIGQYYGWRTTQGLEDFFDEAETNLLQAIVLYNDSHSERQARTRVHAARAYGTLGGLYIELDPDLAIEYFESSIHLFEQDINRLAYQELIDSYKELVELSQSER